MKINRQVKIRAAAWTAAVLVSLAVMVGYFKHVHRQEPVSYGVSFSIKYARELGLDWRQTYLALLDDAGFGRVRLMSYWDLLEPEKGRLDFNALDWQFEQAAKRGVKVTLAVGLRQPRYPECHYPGWFEKLDHNQKLDALYAYLGAVVDRYKHSPVLESWQLENEALNSGFGACNDHNRHRIIEEARQLKLHDQTHPLIMNASDEAGLPLRSPRGDQVGFSVYKTFYESHLKRYLTYPWPAWFHSVRAAVIEWYSGRTVIIHELQAEPWGPVGTEKLTAAEQNKTMNIEQLNYMLVYTRKTGIRHIDLWGGEWWYWRKLQGDGRFWEAVKQTLTACKSG